MTRKDFELIARVLRDVKCNLNGFDAQDQWRVTCIEFANNLAGVNLRFDRARFLKACGVEE